MIHTEWQKRVLAVRREHRDMLRAGWEYLGEGGGRLWELYRGGRTRHVITDVRISCGGKALWIKTSEPA